MTKKQSLIILTILIFTCLAGIIFYRIYKNSSILDVEQKIEKALTIVTPVSFEELTKKASYIKVLGIMESTAQVDMKSEVSSTVRQIAVRLGENVKQGQLLVAFDHSGQSAQLLQARASIERAQSILDLQKAGPTKENQDRVEASVEQASIALRQAETQLKNTIQSNENKIKNSELSLKQTKESLTSTSVGNEQQYDSGYDSALNSARSIIVSVNNILITATQLQSVHFNCLNHLVCERISTAKEKFIRILYGVNNGGYFNIENVSTLNGGLAELILKNEYAKNEIDLRNDIKSLGQAIEHLQEMLTHLRSGMDTYLGASITSIEKTSIETARFTVQGYATQISAAINALEQISINGTSSNTMAQLNYERAILTHNTLIQQFKIDEELAWTAVRAQESLVSQSKATLASLIAKPREVDLGGAQAGVKEAVAYYTSIATQLEKSFIKAPFNGVISNVSVKKGQNIAIGSSVISLINTKGSYVTAYVNESQAKIIKIGMKALVDDRFVATISHVAPKIDASTKKVQVLIAFDDTKDLDLLIEESVSVRFLIEPNFESSDQIYRFPLEAIKTTSSGTIIFTIKKIAEKDGIGIVEGIPVEIKKISGGTVELKTKTQLQANIMILPSTHGISVSDRVKINNSK